VLTLLAVLVGLTLLAFFAAGLVVLALVARLVFWLLFLPFKLLFWLLSVPFLVIKFLLWPVAGLLLLVGLAAGAVLLGVSLAVALAVPLVPLAALVFVIWALLRLMRRPAAA